MHAGRYATAHKTIYEQSGVGQVDHQIYDQEITNRAVE